MGSDKSPGKEIDKRLEGDPIQVGDRTVKPVVRLKGRQFAAGSTNGGGAGLVANLQPEEMVVSENGEVHSIPLNAPQQESARAIVIAGASVSAVCLVIMLLSRRIAKKLAKR